MPRRKSVKKSKSKLSIVNKNTIKINIDRALGQQIARRTGPARTQRIASKMSGSQQLLTRPNVHYGAPASRYSQAITNPVSVAYDQKGSTLSDKPAVGQPLGIQSNPTDPGNRTGITVDNTPSKRIVLQRDRNHIFQPIESGSNSSRDVFSSSSSGSAFNTNVSSSSMLNIASKDFNNSLGHPVSNGAYMSPAQPSSNLVSQTLASSPYGIGTFSEHGNGDPNDDGKQEAEPQPLASRPPSLDEVVTPKVSSNSSVFGSRGTPSPYKRLGDFSESVFRKGREKERSPSTGSPIGSVPPPLSRQTVSSSSYTTVPSASQANITYGYKDPKLAKDKEEQNRIAKERGQAMANIMNKKP